MKLSNCRIPLLLLLLISFLTVSVGSAEDYLVIKKKSGPTQKIPLNFPPDQIESFQVESGPNQQPASTGAQPQSSGTSEKGAQGTGQRPAAISDEAPPSGSSAQSVPTQETQPQTKGPSLFGPTRRTLGTEKGTSVTGQDQSQPKPSVGPEKGALSVAPENHGTANLQQTPTRSAFTVGVFKLPDNIAGLPDFSAFKASKVISSDRIDLDPAKGENQPAGLPEKLDDTGLRFIGTFLVSGEGLFRWRVESKDGVRLNIDDKTVIENDGIHPSASKDGFTHLAEGVHSIILDSFNSKGAPLLKLFVQPPTGPEELFSISKGLVGWKEPAKPYDVLWGHIYFVPQGNYPDGPDFNKLSPIGRLIAPKLDIVGGNFPGIPGRTDMIGLKYQGFFNVEGAGIFAFRLVADNYAKLMIGKNPIVEMNKGSKNDQGALGWAFLQQGSYPIMLDYFHAKGEPKLQLFVAQPTKPEELFSPAQTLTGFPSDSGKLSLIPAFVYFLPTNTKKMPNFNKLSPAGMFFTKSINYPVDRGSREFPGIPKREEWFGVRFYVKFSLSDQEAGTYKFRVVCDDSARLIIGKKLVINAEGGGGKPVTQSGSVELTPGSHEMFLDYLQTTGPDGVQLFITPPGGQEKIFSFD
ncbi:MAG: PA14 domain-containing protein [Deltaproteobacteria bacterium]|nr:PA14 domain-containing protein [Deltaproteobacteria bacterium]